MEKRKITVYVLSLMMALSLSGCGNTSNGTMTTAPSDTTPTAISDANATTTPPIATSDANATTTPPIATSGANTTTTAPSSSDTTEVTSEADNSNITTSKTCMLDKWHNIFSGTIGTDEICMDIYQDGNNIIAFYVNKDSDKEIKLVGNIDGFNISLKDDTQNTLTGTVTSADEPGGHFQGTFTQSNGNRLPVVLEFDYACGDNLDNFYEIMGSNNQEVETFVNELKNDVISANKQTVAQLINYPINVVIGDKDTTINSSQEFTDNYDKIMNKNFVNIISNANTKLLFHNYQGAMFGDNFKNIWIQKIEDRLEIVGINN